jgi:tetratricopeptide (TPR) repeat protein
MKQNSFSVSCEEPHGRAKLFLKSSIEKLLKIILPPASATNYPVNLKPANPNDSHVNRDLAGEYCTSGLKLWDLENYEGAIIDFSKALEIDPEFSQAYLLRGKVKQIAKDYNGAIADFNRSMNIKPVAEAFILRGLARFHIKAYKGVIADFAKALDLDPQWTTTYQKSTVELIYHRRAFSKDCLGDFKGAVKDYTKAIQTNPKEAKAFENRGFSKHSLKDFKGAIEDFNKAIEIEPGLGHAYYGRGMTRIAMRLKNDARLDLLKAIELGSVKAKEALKNLNSKS